MVEYGQQARGAVMLRRVTRRYRPAGGQQVLALDGIDLEIDAGESVALTGPSGSGKSTLLHLIGGMDRPDDGQVVVNGTKVSEMSAHELTRYRRSVGFVFQKFHLLPGLTVADNVIAPVLPRRVDFDKRGRAAELLAAVGLADRADAMPHELSGGQQQRVAIARALLAYPELLLADEPTGNLDSANGAEIVALMLQLRARYGTTLVVATHNTDVAAACDREVRLHDGRIADAEGETRADGLASSCAGPAAGDLAAEHRHGQRPDAEGDRRPWQ
jgi:putative ABC transport system ATP-binding protein